MNLSFSYGRQGLFPKAFTRDEELELPPKPAGMVVFGFSTCWLSVDSLFFFTIGSTTISGSLGFSSSFTSTTTTFFSSLSARNSAYLTWTTFALGMFGEIFFPGLYAPGTLRTSSTPTSFTFGFACTFAFNSSSTLSIYALSSLSSTAQLQNCGQHGVHNWHQQ